MKFSIIIPVYKTEKYLRQCVDSVLCQSFTDFELVLVDNESPDTCPAICEEYASQDNRVRVIHKKHGTAASARNVGMKSALGEYLCFLDSDDYWIDGEVLSKINGIIIENQVDIVNLYYKFYYESTGEFLIPNEISFDGFEELSNEQKIEFIVKKDRLNPSAWGMCMSRKFIEENEGYFNEALIPEDIDWCIRLFSNAPKLGVLREPVYIYRKNRKDSITANTIYAGVDDHCRVVENAPSVLCDRDNFVHNVMMEYVLYESLVVIGLAYRKTAKITKSQRKELISRMGAFCKKYLKQYHSHPKVNKAYKIYRIFGYKVMAFVLGFYLNHRGR